MTDTENRITKVYYATCLDCRMPRGVKRPRVIFTLKATRDAWTAAHERATGHERYKHEDEWVW